MTIGSGDRGTVISERLMEWVNSNEYPCPGGHHSRKLTPNEEEQEMGHVCWSIDGSFYKEGRLPEGVYFKQEGECAGTINIELEWEGDGEGGAGFSYPVAYGECADALGIGEGTEGLMDHPIIEAFSERRRIRAIIRGEMTLASFMTKRKAREQEKADYREKMVEISRLERAKSTDLVDEFMSDDGSF